MRKTSDVQASFTAGELSPALHARVDLEKFAVGLARCRNFVTHPTGGASNRPGFQFIAEAGDSTAAVRIIPFEFNDTQTYMLEFGDGYLRVFKDGAQVVETAVDTIEANNGVDNTTTMGMRTDGATPGTWAVDKHVYITTAAGNVFGPYRIASISSPDVQLTELDGSVPNILGQAANLAGIKVAGTQMELVYQVTSPYAAAHLFDLRYTQSADVLTIAHPSYALRELTRTGHAAWSFSTPTLNTTGLSPASLFGAADKYAAAVGYYQQRLVLGNINQKVDGNWGSKVGDFDNFTVGSPAADGDGVSFQILSSKQQAIRHYVDAEDLLVFTSEAEWRVTGAANDALTPSSIVAKRQSSNGCSRVPPLVVNDTVLYISRNGRTVRDLSFQLASNKYTGGNLTVLAGHLFKGYTLADWAWQGQDDQTSVVWAARSDGMLLGMTYMPEQDVFGWHWHDLGGDGAVESLAVITEGGFERLWAVVRRTVNGRTARYIERLDTREFSTAADAVFLDSALCFTTVGAITTVSGLEWLEGMTVGIVVEGRVQPQQAVTNGTLNVAALAGETVCIGLPYDADLKSLPINPRGNVLGKRKGVPEVVVRVYQARGIEIGPDEDNLTEVADTILYYDTAPELFTGDLRATVAQGWDDHGQLFIRQSNPLPVTVLAIVPDVVVGG